MTKQKWIFLSLFIGLLWGTDTLVQSLWQNQSSNTAEYMHDKTQLVFDKKSFDREDFKKVKPQKLFQKPVKVVSNQKGVESIRNTQSPSPKKNNELEDLASKYDKKLAQKKKVPAKTKEDGEPSKKQNDKSELYTDSYRKQQMQREKGRSSFESSPDSPDGGYSVITLTDSKNNLSGGTGGVFVSNSDININEWKQILITNPDDSVVNDFISQVVSGEISKDDAYLLVDTLLRSENESDHTNAVKVILAIKSDKSFMLLTDIVSGGFSETVASAAYSGLLNYRSIGDLAIIESVLKKENISLGAIYYSADTILQLSQQNIPTYGGDGDQRSITMLEAYQERFLAVTEVLRLVSSNITDNYVLSQVNQTIAFVGGPESVADSSLAKPNRRALF